MADIRIKDLASTATTTASDDFMAVDGTGNGTRKMSAATPAFLTSVTTPSLTSPAATSLTLGLGTGGTALTLTSSTLAATFAGALTVVGDTSIGTNGFKIDTANTRILLGLAAALQGDTLEVASKGNGGSISLFGRASDNASTLSFRANGAATLKGSIGATDSVVAIVAGSTTRLSIASSTGDVSLSSSTAGSASAGALVLQGGISAGNNANAASYFGGTVSVTVSSGPTLQINNSGTDSPYIGFYRGGTIRSALQLFTDNDFRFYASNLSTYAAISAGAATFGGAVTATSASAHTFGTTNTVTMAAGALTAVQSSTGAVGLASGNTNTAGYSAFTAQLDGNVSNYVLFGVGNSATATTAHRNAGLIYLSPSLTAGLKIYTAGTLAATFDASQNTTFAGAVTADGTATIGSSFAKVIINRWSDATPYGAITFNGNTTVAGSLGIGGGASGDSNFYINAPTGGSIQSRINGTAALTIASTGAATFAGAVTVSGNVGFYNNAPVAKPTGVAVTAAAIHAALVTLNLIAA